MSERTFWYTIKGYADVKELYDYNKTQIHFQPIFDEFNSELVVMVAGISCDHSLTLKALEELCRLYSDTAFEIRSEGGTEFDNKDVKDFP